MFLQSRLQRQLDGDAFAQIQIEGLAVGLRMDDRRQRHSDIPHNE
jgi:hypothetical protein